jgi:hypothetical protein
MMNLVPEGVWVSDTSDIVGYVPGAEWLDFRSKCEDHVWTVKQSTGRDWVCRFRIQKADLGWTFFPTPNGTEVARKNGWPIQLQILPDGRLAVRHHEHTTVFRKVR